MKQAYLRLDDKLKRLVTDPTARVDVLTTAIALAVSREVPLPSSPVATPSNYYNLQCLAQVMRFLDALNENCQFDLKCATNEVRQLWMIRYNAAHPANLPMASDVGFIDTIVGANIVIDKDLLCFANQHKEAILLLCMDIVALLQP